jgi:propanol-preferring alcohol dehydrogenase
MSTKDSGALVRSFKQPLHFEEIDFSDPSPGEVLVQMRASGVCHTDLHAVDGDWPIKPHLPFIPGHEGWASRLRSDAMCGMSKKGTV